MDYTISTSNNLYIYIRHQRVKRQVMIDDLTFEPRTMETIDQLLGHTTTTMTLHYFRNILGKDEVNELMKKLDDVA